MLSQRRSRLIRRLSHRKTREREGLYLVEGVRGVETALESGARLRFSVAAEDLPESAEGVRLLERLEAASVEITITTAADFASVADTRSPQGVLAVCEQPEPAELDAAGARRLLVLDAVQDPGNVGTLVRVAAGFGLDAVLALDGTADPWGTKAVRASAGYIAAVPVIGLPWEEAVPLLERLELPLLVASEAGASVGAEPAPDRWALVVGNEGDGPRPEILERAAHRVGVPIEGDVDSLNVAIAGSILLFALTRTPDE